MASTEELLERIALATEETFRWQRAAVLPQVRQTIEKALTTTKMRQAFELCDGEKTSQDIAKAVGGSKGGMSGWTRKWRDLGIAYEMPDGKIRHLISLDALSLPVEIDEPSKKGK